MEVVILGAGQAGFQAALSLRAEGLDGPVTLVDGEGRLPYNRPPLSKAFLTGKVGEDDIALRPSQFYERQRIDLRMGDPAVRIDRQAREVELASGRRLAWSRLILATGARVRELPVRGARPNNLVYLRTLDDAVALRAAVEDADDVLAIGAGFVGLEAASAFGRQGKRVRVVAAEDRVMGRAVSPPISAWFDELHRSRGIELRLGTAVAAIDGEEHGAGVVLVGIGVIPNVELAAEAGLATRDGVVVDEYLRTSDPDVYAIGDCARFSGRRIESVQNAVDQAKCVAAAITGRAVPYSQVPWFWTEQFEARLQIAGIAAGCDRFVERGDRDSGKFSVFCFEGAALRAVESINRPADHMAARKMLELRAPIAPDQAADESFDLKAAIASGARISSP